MLQVFGVDERPSAGVAYTHTRYQHCESFELHGAAHYLYIIGITEAKTAMQRCWNAKDWVDFYGSMPTSPIRLLLLQSGLNNNCTMLFPCG